MLTSFSNETIEQLKYYVYRLIDPRTGLTFYVGKGKGNRVFAHANQALKNFHGKNYISEDDSEINLKLQVINEIRAVGLDVIHVIHRSEMDSKTAFEVEGALIDAFPGLTNITNGHHNNDNGIGNAVEIENRFSRAEYVDSEDNPRYIIIKTSKWRIEDLEGAYADKLYYATRHCWKLSPNTAKKYPYVLSVVDGVVKEVYKVERWEPVNDGRGRYAFHGHIAEEKIRNIFKDHRIPSKYRKRGQASPFLYSKA